MKINNFNKTGYDKVKELNSYLKENHGVKVSGFHPKAKLEKVREQAQQHVITLRNTNKKFNLDPEYAKYLLLKQVQRLNRDPNRCAPDTESTYVFNPYYIYLVVFKIATVMIDIVGGVYRLVYKLRIKLCSIQFMHRK